MTDLPRKIVIIMGPTASGKTVLAVQLARRIDGEIISADSRQVFKGMNLGTGKDLDEYQNIRYHLIDILAAGAEFSVADFQGRAHAAINEIVKRDKIPLICGGTGYYIKALIEDYQFDTPSSNFELTRNLEKKSRSELYEELKKIGIMDQRNWAEDSKRRIVRALEKAACRQRRPSPFDFQKEYCSRIYYTDIDRELLRHRIRARLDKRITAGLVDEVKGLLSSDLNRERLERYGLEYKWISLYLHGEMSFQDMKEKLNTEIRRFAKRQKTFIRYLRKRGHPLVPITDPDIFLKDASKWVDHSPPA